MRGRRDNSFYNCSLTRINQIQSVSQLYSLFETADGIKKSIEKGKELNSLKGKTVATLFYQPSMRTYTSFVAAAKRLGAYTSSIHRFTNFSSTIDGERLEDTVRSLHATTNADLLVLRHPEDNAADISDSVLDIPVINAGCGTLEHPTQSLLDLYTIYRSFGRLHSLNIAMIGDLKYSRTIKSLAKLLSLVSKDTTLTLVSPRELRLPKDLVKELKDTIELKQKTIYGHVFEEADVIYMTRVGHELFEHQGRMDEYERLRLQFIISQEHLGRMKKNALILHPFPRSGEILQEVDSDPRAGYFEQMRSGLYIRMALMQSILCTSL